MFVFMAYKEIADGKAFGEFGVNKHQLKTNRDVKLCFQRTYKSPFEMRAPLNT